MVLLSCRKRAKSLVFDSITNTLGEWRKGVRLYIALAMVTVTLDVWLWAAVTYSDSILFATRMEEVYAWLALGLLALAVAIGPVYSIWPGLPGKLMMRDARRLVGVGAAWFATLHATIAYVSLFKVANPLDLPHAYQQSFALAIVGTVILLAMAFTSFDRASRSMGIWWFRLHRFVYLAILVSLLHAFIIGTHATEWLALIVLAITALTVLGMHVYLAFIKNSKPTTWQLLAISSVAILLLAIFNYGYRQHLR